MDRIPATARAEPGGSRTHGLWARCSVRSLSAQRPRGASDRDRSSDGCRSRHHGCSGRKRYQSRKRQHLGLKEASDTSPERFVLFLKDRTLKLEAHDPTVPSDRIISQLKYPKFKIFLRGYDCAA